MSNVVEPTQSRSGKTDWVSMIFIITYHVALVVALPLYLMAYSPSWALIGWTAFFFLATTISITAGYHRYYSHRTYKLKKPAEWGLLFFGTLAIQGSVLRWAFDHRLHHTFIDGDRDPYGTPQGFWQSHILWMFKHGEDFDDRFLGELKEDKLLQFQHKYFGWLIAAVNIAVVAFVGWLTGDYIGSFVFVFLLRLFLGHHCTWFINSLAHIWGSKPYSTEHSAVNNFILAILTSGEGYHNYHHTFASDYRNGIRWYQYDPTKYLIWTLSKLGLAYGLKRTDPLMIKKKLVQADRKLLTEHLSLLGDMDMAAFEAAVDTLSAKLTASFTSAKNTLDKYRSIDRKENKGEWKELRAKYKELKREISQDLKTWRRLCTLILKMEPQLA
ncbi:MAG: acyl-CoA desaturase [Rhodothermales bacterium]